MMKFHFRFLFLLSVILGGLFSGTEGLQAQRQVIPFDADWKFHSGEDEVNNTIWDYAQIKSWLLPLGNRFADTPAPIPTGEPGPVPAYAKPDFDDSAWRSLTLPHDWGVEGPFKQEYPASTGKLHWWGIGWYRKTFDIPAEDQGKSVFVDFDGAMAYSLIWVNGRLVGGWPYGFSSFQIDLTPFLNFGGPNVIAVRLNNPSNSSRWYPGGGIYRHVRLTTVSPLRIAQWGTRVTTPEVASDHAEVVVENEVENQAEADVAATVRTEIFPLDATGKPASVAVAKSDASCHISAKSSLKTSSTLNVPQPALWSPESPSRYLALTTVLDGAGHPVDVYHSIFGIRTAVFDAQQGLLLNGKVYKIYGVCDHADLGPLGTAVFTRGLERQIELLKEMGCNAIRTSHNPPAPEFLDLCDRMGMLVMDEAFDCWAQGKTPNDYHHLFPDWHAIDLRAMIQRDRNHPCIIIWGVGNEIREEAPPIGTQIAHELTAIAHDADPTRPTAIACNSWNAPFNGMQKEVGLYGFNYGIFLYQQFAKQNPTIPFFGSETSSAVSSRGFYAFPINEKQDGGLADFQVSSYDLSAPPWAHIPDVEFKFEEQNPASAGEFVWTGFDYLGEPTPYNGDVTNLLNFHNDADRAKAQEELTKLGRIVVPSRSSYFGIFDLCGFKKDRFYLYQAHWRPDLPMAHILPHWTWPGREGQVTPVHVYTSGDEAELFVNGISQGKKKKGPFEYRLRWDDVVYQPGELRVVAYRQGKEWAEDSVRTAGPVAVLKVTADRTAVDADGNDLIYVTIDLLDAAGNSVPQADNLLHFAVDGPGSIAGVDNGDATSHQSFQADNITAFNGKALVIVRTKAGQAGHIVIRVSSDGLPSSEAAADSVLPTSSETAENTR